MTELVSQYFELAGSRAFNKDTQKIILDDAQTNSLSAIIHACNSASGSSSSLMKGRAFCNMDAGRDMVAAPGGIMTLHDPDAPVNPEMITDEMFQYLVVIPIEHPEDLGQEYTDAYFQTEETRARLNEAIPQYGESPFSMTKHRSRRDNRDINTWEAELGQDNAWAGIVKGMHENHEDCDYYVVARAGAPYACAELRAMVADSTDASAGRTPMTWSEFDMCDETSAVRANAQINARRLAYNVGLACRVVVTNVQDGEACGDTQPSMALGAKMVCQRISTVDELRVADPQHVPGGRCIAMFNEVTPAYRVQDGLFVVGSGADVMLRFNMSEFLPTDVGVPCTTGRHAQLPDTPMQAKERVERDPELKKRHAKAAKRFIWEGKSNLPFHPDINPDSHYSALPKRDHTFVNAMCALGWDRSAEFDKFYPVLIKLSNPYLKRPTDSVISKNNGGDAMVDFD